MNSKIIFVNATALTSGGGLSTLKQFIQNIPINQKNTYYIFCSDYSLEKDYPKSNIEYVYPNYKVGMKRIYWDFYGLKKWSYNKKIIPDLIISLQNTTIRFNNKNIPQISYIMQAIPFVNKKWNLFNKQERTLWFYRNIYPLFMSMYLGEKHYVVTQSKWIKEEFSKKFKFPLEKIFPIRPIINLDKPTTKKDLDKNNFNIFCPSSAFVYKNNIEIVNALIYLKSINQDISKFKIYITLKEEDDPTLYHTIIENNINNNFSFIGRISYDEMLSYYTECDVVVFPSYLETFGLPLLEAASFGKAIIASNEGYAKEVIGNYSGSKLLDINSPQKWGESLILEYNERNSYDTYTANFKESWDDMFILIDRIISKS